MMVGVFIILSFFLSLMLLFFFGNWLHELHNAFGLMKAGVFICGKGNEDVMEHVRL
jgi:hypothetical protein